jgi:hypothetical protein
MTATPIGNTGLRLPIALSVNGTGNIFTYDIDDDMLYGLNSTTGAATAKGSIGFNADFGGGMTFDTSSGNTYITSYNPAIGDTQLRIVDLITGMTTVVGTVNPGTTTQIAWGSAVNSDDLGVRDSSLFGFGFAPNPANNVLQFTSLEAIEWIEVYSILGQQLLKKDLRANQGTLDVSNLETGTYILKVTVNGQLGSFRFIKQ